MNPLFSLIWVCLLFSTAVSSEQQIVNEVSVKISFDELPTGYVQLNPRPLGIGGRHSMFGKSIAMDGNRALVGSDAGGGGAVFVMEYDGNNWIQTAVLQPDFLGESHKFGAAVSLEGDRAIISDGGYFGNGGGSGVYVFEFRAGLWEQVARLSGSQSGDYDLFGTSLSLSGDRLLIGAWDYVDFHTPLVPNGLAYVFEFDGLNWNETAILEGDNSFDYFGNAVTLDGNRAIVSAYYDDELGEKSGAAYVFKKNVNSWTLDQKIVPPMAVEGTLFADSVATSNNRIVIGARRDSESGVYAGAAYVYDYNGTDWVYSAKLLASDGIGGDGFGNKVSINNNQIVIGASNGNTGNVLNTGAAYIFEFDGASWQETHKISASNFSVGDKFGSTLAQSGDRILIGAPQNEVNDQDEGAVYAFTKTAGTWSESQYMSWAIGAARDEFGTSVNIYGDLVLVGAVGDVNNNAIKGAAYLFQRNTGSSSLSAWNLLEKFTASDGEANDLFGKSVNLSESWAAVGAEWHDGISSNSGAVYLYSINEIPTEIKVEPSGESRYFGYAVDIEDNRMVVGSPGNVSAQGAVYVYEYDSIMKVWNQSAILGANDAHNNDQLGCSVSQNKQFIIAAACRHDKGAIYVFEENKQDLSWNQVGKLIASDVQSSSGNFGASLSLHDNQLLVGAHNGAYLFRYENNTWEQIYKFENKEAEISFGVTGALFENTAVIGEWIGYNELGFSTGSISSYRFVEGSWQFAKKYFPPEKYNRNRFGYSLSLFENIVAVGAPHYHENGKFSGSSFVIDVDLIFTDGFE